MDCRWLSPLRERGLNHRPDGKPLDLSTCMLLSLSPPRAVYVVLASALSISSAASCYATRAEGRVATFEDEVSEPSLDSGETSTVEDAASPDPHDANVDDPTPGRGDADAAPLPTGLRAFVTGRDLGAALAELPRTEPLGPAVAFTITIDPSSTQQIIEGFGFALTGGSAQHLARMSEPARSALLERLFGREDGQLGLSALRISVGASDLDAEPFSYNDDAGDPEHRGFSFGPHEEHLLPMLGQIAAVQPRLTLFAAPWSAPSWMKSSGGPIGGSLLTEHYASYAAYLVRYLDQMRTRGLEVDYLSIQNEPLHDSNNPSMRMSADEQARFVADALGPLLSASGLGTRLLVWDHNADRPEYPLAVYEDEAAAAFVHGAAFHLYGGDISALSEVHAARPDKAIYFTEQWYDAEGDPLGDVRWHVQNVIIGALRNWARAVIEWNLTSTPALTPHTEGGCTRCLGALTIDGDGVRENAGYVAMSHASRWIETGAVVVSTEETGAVHNVAAINPSGERALIAYNASSEQQRFGVTDGASAFVATLEGGEIATFVWAGP